MSFRIRAIQCIIDINEKLIFYPRLKKIYYPKLKDGEPTILDIGTNKGQSIDFFLNINPKATLYGFEPNTTLFAQLVNKYKMYSNVKLNNLGVSSKKGTLVFNQNVMDETSTFEKLNQDSEYLKKKARVLGVSTDTIIVSSYEVQVTTINSFLEEYRDIFIDVIKIDVEGHEYDCLKGLFDIGKKKYPVRYIQLESHHDDMYVNNNQDNIVQLLNSNGFIEVAKIKHGFGDFYEIIYENSRLDDGNE